MFSPQRHFSANGSVFSLVYSFGYSGQDKVFPAPASISSLKHQSSHFQVLRRKDDKKDTGCYVGLEMAGEEYGIYWGEEYDIY